MKARIFGQERDDIKVIHFVDETLKSGQAETDGAKSYIITTSGEVIEFDGYQPDELRMEQKDRIN